MFCFCHPCFYSFYRQSWISHLTLYKKYWWTALEKFNNTTQWHVRFPAFFCFLYKPGNMFYSCNGRWPKHKKSLCPFLWHTFSVWVWGAAAWHKRRFFTLSDAHGQKHWAECFANICVFVYKCALCVNGCSLASERRWVVVGSHQLLLALLWTENEAGTSLAET